MPRPDSTRWSLIRGAAKGEGEARREFAGRYASIVRAYLGARWRNSPLRAEIDDASQEVFLACFQDDGALTRAEPGRSGGFRAYLFGVVRNVARRFEKEWPRRHRQPDSRLDLAEIEGRDAPLSRLFDAAWARTLIGRAVDLFGERARESGDGALRRVELLRLRIREDMPIREIARCWDQDPARLHHEYARAREEFARALADLVRESHPGTPAEIRAECARIGEYLRK